MNSSPVPERIPEPEDDESPWEVIRPIRMQEEVKVNQPEHVNVPTPPKQELIP